MAALSKHAWHPTVLVPARFSRDLKLARPAVLWWPSCERCGAQVCSAGKTLFYRATSANEWTAAESACGGAHG